MDPVVCDSCNARFSVNDLTQDDGRALEDQHYYQHFAEELRMLLKVQDFYRRHPNAEGLIKSHIARLLESSDPAVVERLCDGIPFGEIEIPLDELSIGSDVTGEDSEVVKHLRHNDFALAPRMEFVSQQIARLKALVRAVGCPRCQVGRLHVLPEEWDEFTMGDSITWYWPDWHSVDNDGTLHVKASGHHGNSHWSGEKTISPKESDYGFWRWLVAQKEYHRLVKETELSAIREVLSRRAKPCT
jgi:hypothetical protein